MTAVPHQWARGPLDDEELFEAVLTLTGRKIPRTKVCDQHVAPFKVFSDIYFGRTPLHVIHGSRGFGGKTVVLGTLAVAMATWMGASVVVLGGSAAQSLRVRETIDEVLEYERYPKDLIKHRTRYDVFLNNGGHIRALMASQRSVRGPHPQVLLLDEIDEMDLDILESSLGQPMSAKGIPATIVMASTWQYPDATFAEVMKRAKQNHWPVAQWCFRESSAPPDGWLTKSDIELRKAQVSKATWLMEYELQEPVFEGRAIDTEAVDACFDESLGTYAGDPGELLIFEEPKEGARYVTGVDWAKEKDWTVIRTFRTDVWPWREVAFERIARVPWPQMVARLDRRIDTYRGIAAHDATGIGNVVSDLLKHDVRGVVMQGRRRDAMLSEYVAAIEDRAMLSPRITWAHAEHRYCRLDDLYGSGHPPDSLVSGAMAWSLRHESRGPLPPALSITREVSPWYGGEGVAGWWDLERME